MSVAENPEGYALLSPEGVRLDFPVAGPAPRIFAYAIDYVVIIVIIALVITTLLFSLPVAAKLATWFGEMGEAFEDLSSDAATSKARSTLLVFLVILILVQFLVETGYFVFWEMVTSGQSPGKAALGLRVVRQGGLPIDFRSSAIRNLLRIADMLPGNYIIGLLSMLVSSNAGRLGDHAAGTLVIRLDRPAAAPEIRLPHDLAPFALTRSQLARIGPPELALIRGALRRVDSLPADRREHLLQAASESLRQRLELDEIPTHDRQRFLLEILAAAERFARS